MILNSTVCGLIRDERCIPSLGQSLKRGRNELDTFVLCASIPDGSHQWWHMPKIGAAKLMLDVKGGEVVAGTITPEGGTSHDILGIVAGLSGACVAVVVKRGNKEVKLLLDIPLAVEDSKFSPYQAAYSEMLHQRSKAYGRVDLPLEDVAKWLQREDP